MTKTRKRTGPVRGAKMPSWVTDENDQRKWNAEFVRILKRDYLDLDPVVSAILGNQRLSKICATKIRSYVDKAVTIYWYDQSKARGSEYKRRLELAIAGINVAVSLYLDREDRDTAQYLSVLEKSLSQALGRCKDAFATKRHGRDQDHSFLLQCQSFLQTKLGRPITYVTLANLVNAGYEAERNDLKKTVCEEQIRKNLAQFKRNNPHWRLYGSPNCPA